MRKEPQVRSWGRTIIRKIFGANFSQERAAKYLFFARLAYFFSAGSLLILVLDLKKRIDNEDKPSEEKLLQAGIPVIEDFSPAHKSLREKGVEQGHIIVVTEKGVEKKPYNREEYLKELEQATLEKAREAQRKLLAQGKELPPDAIRLV